MKKILFGIALAALFTLTATAAQAIVWPTANFYTCDWTLGSTSGKAFVTFLYNPYNSPDITRTGNIRTVYPSGSTVTKPFTLSWDWGSGSDYRFDYTQTQDGIQCDVLTANAGKDVTFYNCSNGAWQHCIQ